MQWSIVAVKFRLRSYFYNSLKAHFSISALEPNFFRGDASFELHMTRIGSAYLKLLDAAFKLEIFIPVPKREVLES
jgi:hypothetical protein